MISLNALHSSVPRKLTRLGSHIKDAVQDDLTLGRASLENELQLQQIHVLAQYGI